MRYLLTVLLFISGIASADVTGTARVVDGDTVKIDKTRIRLHGIDAPERKQRCKKGGYMWWCGKKATKTLWRYTKGKTVTCKGNTTDRYKRLIAVCYVGSKDLNAAMVDAGMALAYRKYSTKYVSNENKARKAKKGVWSGEFIYPWDWRKGERLKPGKPGKPDKPLGCCKICKKGKACGDSCMKKTYSCGKPKGCACNKK